MMAGMRVSCWQTALVVLLMWVAKSKSAGDSSNPITLEEAKAAKAIFDKTFKAAIGVDQKCEKFANQDGFAKLLSSLTGSAEEIKKRYNERTVPTYYYDKDMVDYNIHWKDKTICNLKKELACVRDGDYSEDSKCQACKSLKDGQSQQYGVKDTCENAATIANPLKAGGAKVVGCVFVAGLLALVSFAA